MSEIYQIQVSLRGSKPKIWRRILIESNTKLPVLHQIIQIIAGWRNQHMHQFIKNGKYYGNGTSSDDIIDYKDTTVKDLLKKEKDKMTYEYDFGDSWEHFVLLEKILPIDDQKKYPLCVTGKKSFPPDNCGGLDGYDDLLEILANPKHKDHEEMKFWLKEFGHKNFDSDRFDVNEINEVLENMFS